MNGEARSAEHDERIRRWVAIGVLAQFLIVVFGLMFYMLYAESVLNATIPSEYYTVLGIVLTGEIQSLQALLSHYFRPLGRAPTVQPPTNNNNAPPANNAAHTSG
jgi:hypothetical protein